MTTERYNARDTETRWQKIWDDQDVFATRNGAPGPKYYVLEMFPYPSGRIHMGHVRNYTMGDVVARYKRAAGFNVLHPMGWDAFGMPAENAAMANKIHPKTWTYQNIAAMKAQLRSMGLSLDWKREIATCDPSYYKHQQKMFLDFWRAGLVERRKSKVNWDPVDQTVLANEQVIEGRGWRSGALVEQRELTQWFFKITAFAQDLLDSIDRLERWPEKVRTMQRNWIGRSEGLLIRFALAPATTPNGESELDVFTTRPDTLFGAKFLALAPDHPLALEAAAKNPALADFIAECRLTGTAQELIDKAEKRGFDTGMKAIHPFDPGWKLPVYVANFILMDYGTGAIFGCPAHDQRDLDFANKYGLGNTPVVLPPSADAATFVVTDSAYDGDGRMINSRFLDGMTIQAAKEEIARRLEAQTRGNRPVAVRQVNFRLRDWGISRQRYWGCPIPVIHCTACGVVGVPELELPVRLPEDVEFDRPGNPLDRHPTWKQVACPSCGSPARRETDTMDTFVDLRGISRASPIPGSRPRRPRGAAVDAWLPVDQYIGGIEHAILHLLYSRFFTRAMKETGLGRIRRAVRRAVHPGHGGARNLSARRRRTCAALGGDDRNRGRPARRQADPDRRADRDRPDREDVEVQAQHGRSRRHHGDLWGRRGALVRAVGFAARGRRHLERKGVQGAWRFVQRLWRLVADAALVALATDMPRPPVFSPPALALRKAAHRALACVSEDIERLRFNVCVAHIHEFANAFQTSLAEVEAPPMADYRWAVREAAGILVRLFHPMMPHLAEECWSVLGYTTLLASETWPVLEPHLLEEDTVTLPVQINGRKRAEVTVGRDATNAEIETAVLALDVVKQALDGRAPKKVIVVPHRIVNVVV